MNEQTLSTLLCCEQRSVFLRLRSACRQGTDGFKGGEGKRLLHLVSSETRRSRRPCVHRVFLLWNSLAYLISEITPKTNHTGSAFCHSSGWNGNLIFELWAGFVGRASMQLLHRNAFVHTFISIQTDVLLPFLKLNQVWICQAIIYFRACDCVQFDACHLCYYILCGTPFFGQERF